MNYDFCFNSNWTFNRFQNVRNIDCSDRAIAELHFFAEREVCVVLTGAQNGSARITFDGLVDQVWYRCEMDVVVYDHGNMGFFGGCRFAEPSTRYAVEPTQSFSTTLAYNS